MSIRFLLLLAVSSCICFVAQEEVLATSYTLYSVSFGSVAVGDSSVWTINGVSGGLSVYAHFWNPRMGIDQYTQSSFRLWMPGISIVTQAFYDIHDAINQYHSRYDIDPASFQQLTDSGYYHLPDEIAEQWVFAFGGQNRITTLHAQSTAEMPYGAGRMIWYNCSNRLMMGWGITEFQVNVPDGESLPLVFSTHPGSPGEFRDTVLYDIGVTGHPPSLFMGFTMVVNAFVSVKEPDPVVPEEINLSSPFPNPFNSTTFISFSLPRESWSRLAVMDQTGREVALLREGWSPAGEQRVSWNATGLPSGAYYPTLMMNGRSKSVRVVFVR